MPTAAQLLIALVACGNASAALADAGSHLFRIVASESPASSYPSVFEYGIASWYQVGERTASGEAFNADALTAAHPRLPFGTRVKVVDPRNDRSIVVRINDRGPFIRGRILDLSRGAARALGMRGVAAVTIHGLEARYGRVDVDIADDEGRR
jgi:rare lipoprotein A